MPTTVSGTTGVSQVQDGTIQTADIVDGAVTAPKLAGGQSGNAPIFGARAWASFNGTLAGTNAPAAGGNITSITRNGVGSYTVTMAIAMPDTDYAVIPMCQPSDSNSYAVNMQQSVPRTTTTFTIRVTSQSATLTDVPLVAFAVFR